MSGVTTAAPDGGAGSRRRGPAGFSLVEVMAVVTILGIVAAAVVFSVRGVGDDADDAARAADRRVLRTAQEAYHAIHDAYAPDEATLVAAGLLGGESALWNLALQPGGGYEICPPHTECPRYSLATAEDTSGFAALLQEWQAGQQPVPAAPGALATPVVGPVTSHFGFRVHPILGTVRFHAGTDFGAPSGAPVGAAGDGVVLVAGPRGGYGNVVVLDHGDALATIYAHQTTVAVTVGDTVTAGQTIGYVGSTGFSTGPHLHLEVRELGTPVDPLAYLPPPDQPSSHP